MSLKITPVILCGGSGTRLWPLSRTGFPQAIFVLDWPRESVSTSCAQARKVGKQRNWKCPNPSSSRVKTTGFWPQNNCEKSALLWAQPCSSLLGRNTAPALTLAALSACEGGEDPILVVTPADQTVTDTERFTHALHQAIGQPQPTAPSWCLGITPQHSRKPAMATFRRRLRSTEPSRRKPCSALSKSPTRPPRNATWTKAATTGTRACLCSKPLSGCSALEPVQTRHFARPRTTHGRKRSTDAAPLSARARPSLLAIPAESVDYAVMERCPGSAFPIHMVPLDAGWNDLGAWDAVWNVLPKDEHGNAHVGDVLHHRQPQHPGACHAAAW